MIATNLAGQSPAEAYERYLVRALFAPWAADLVKKIGPRSGERVLDVACGTGAVARIVGARLDRFQAVVGVDLSFPMLAVARRSAMPLEQFRVPSCEFRVPVSGLRESSYAQPGTRNSKPAIQWCQGNALALPFADASFDVVLCQQALQFFPDKLAALSEMRRVLVAGGRLGLSVWGSLEASPGYRVLIALEQRHLGFSPRLEAFGFPDATALRALLQSAGFEDVAVHRGRRAVHFPSVETFVRASLLASAGLLPVFNELNSGAQEALIRTMVTEAAVALEQYVGPSGLVFPMRAHVALATAHRPVAT